MYGSLSCLPAHPCPNSPRKPERYARFRDTVLFRRASRQTSREALPSSEPALLRGRRHDLVPGLSDGCRIPQTRYALQFHLRRSVRPGQTFGDFEKDQTRFDGVRKLPPVGRYSFFRGIHPAGLYGLDAQFRRLRFLPEKHRDRTEYLESPPFGHLYGQAYGRPFSRPLRTPPFEKGSVVRSVR